MGNDFRVGSSSVFVEVERVGTVEWIVLLLKNWAREDWRSLSMDSVSFETWDDACWEDSLSLTGEERARELTDR